MINEQNSNYYLEVKIADIIIGCSLVFKETASFLNRFIYKSEILFSEIVHINEFDIQKWKDKGNQLNAYGEYSLLCAPVSDYLMKHNCCLIHAVAFKHNNKAYLIAAPSGTGKSTQIMYLNKLYPNEFSVISGDRPCLKFEDDGNIVVYPTPWNGKENWYGAEACPLAGVFILNRCETTNIEKLNEKDAVFPVFLSIISGREDEYALKKVAEFTEKIILRYPIFLYNNGGVPSSTKVFYEMLSRQEVNHEV